MGNLKDPAVLLAIFGFLLTGCLMIWRVRAAILLSILVVSGLAFITGIATFPEHWFGFPQSLSPIFLHLDIAGAFTWGFFSVVLTIFVMDFVDTAGTLLGLAFKANMLDESGHLPEIEKPMLCDALATIVASLLGTTSAGAYIESASGIEAGGRSGLTAVFCALLFLLTLLMGPFLTAIPTCAYGPALIIVGMFMLSPVAKINFDDYTEVIPVFSIIALMCFTYNLGIGITASFVIYPLMKVIAGRHKEVSSGLWILTAISLLFFIFYPY